MDTDLMEVVERTEVPEDLYRTKQYQTVVTSTAEIMCWINDIHSLAVEVAAGDSMNMVVLLRNWYHLSPEEAVAQVETRITDRVYDYRGAAGQLPALMRTLSVTAPARDGILRCVRDQGSWMVGMEKWDRTDTVRFSGAQVSDAGQAPRYVEDLL